MGRETKAKKIGDFSYSTTQLGAIEGRRLLVRLLHVAGPALAALSSKDGDLATGLSKLSETLTDDDLTYVCDLFAKNSRVELDQKRQPQLSDIFDDHFAGRYLEMCQWLAFCLEVNFGPFLKGLSAKRAADASEVAQTK